MTNFQLLNNVQHKDLKVIIDRSADLGDNVWYAVTFPNEFKNLQRHYPVFFIKNPDDGEFQAVAMFGVEEGENLFLDNCAACHGDEGTGDRFVGAPNLTDAIWLYGSDKAALTQTVTFAHKGVMPAWSGRLSESQIRQAAVYIHSLGGGE